MELTRFLGSVWVVVYRREGTWFADHPGREVPVSPLVKSSIGPVLVAAVCTTTESARERYDV